MEFSTVIARRTRLLASFLMAVAFICVRMRPDLEVMSHVVELPAVIPEHEESHLNHLFQRRPAVGLRI
jgi:hypothetical protein